MLHRILHFLFPGSIWKCPLFFHCPVSLYLYYSSKQIIQIWSISRGKRSIFLIQNKVRQIPINLFFVQKFGRIIVLLELMFAIIATLILWIPTGPENSSFIFNCLGKDDVIYFKYDYFTPGGYSRKRKFCMFDNIIGRYLCQGYLVILALMTANIFEIFLTSAVMLEMSKSTASVAKLLSGRSLVERKR